MSFDLSVEIRSRVRRRNIANSLRKQNAHKSQFSGSNASTRVIMSEVRSQLLVSAASIFCPALVIE